MKKIEGYVIASTGLTARLSSKIVAEANRFKSNLTIKVFDEDADLKSIMNVMALVIPSNTPFEIIIEGDDEEIAEKEFIVLLKELELMK